MRRAARCNLKIADRPLLVGRRLRGDIKRAFEVRAVSTVGVPLVTANVAAGFPSPADDYLDRPLDFNELLIENAPATFAVRVAGDSMIGAGIFPNDIAVVNRARAPKDQRFDTSGRGSICTVAVMPAARRTPSGT